ncbi:MAG: multiple sugar transport system permease protein, partial [Pseudothermotoga sp.]|nr:multiple sugar transport system permease protein [Pseudothermotoga sp.]MDN5292127.1 multiple sugar transport system permease protein [Anaerophaga sp.]
MKKHKRFWTAMFFVLPGIIGLLVFRIYPI